MYVDIDEAVALIKEGDIFLFRGNHIYWFCHIPFFTPSFFVSKFCHSPYTHVGMASFAGGVLECLEFKEFKGGRGVALRNLKRLYNGEIDVFRIRPVTIFDEHLVPIELEPNHHAATSYLRSLTGSPYHWRTLIRIIKYYIFGYRFLMTKESNINIDGYVCSTAIAHTVKLHFTDIVPGRPDPYITPADISKSALVQYLFTIK